MYVYLMALPSSFSKCSPSNDKKFVGWFVSSPLDHYSSPKVTLTMETTDKINIQEIHQYTKIHKGQNIYWIMCMMNKGQSFAFGYVIVSVHPENYSVHFCYGSWCANKVTLTMYRCCTPNFITYIMVCRLWEHLVCILEVSLYITDNSYFFLPKKWYSLTRPGMGETGSCLPVSTSLVPLVIPRKCTLSPSSRKQHLNKFFVKYNCILLI